MHACGTAFSGRPDFKPVQRYSVTSECIASCRQGIPLVLRNGSLWRSSLQSNAAGARVHFGTREGFTELYYCGRAVLDTEISPNGRCGPDGGPQCHACAAQCHLPHARPHSHTPRLAVAHARLNSSERRESLPKSCR